MAAWLAGCRERGVKPIPADDPVWQYAADVGIGEEILALHWWQFKRKRQATAKKQRGHLGWAQTFRNSVEANWFRLWLMKPGQAAELTTVGLQAMAARSAEVRAAEARQAEAMRGGMAAGRAGAAA